MLDWVSSHAFILEFSILTGVIVLYGFAVGINI
jgi:hypothetical protein